MLAAAQVDRPSWTERDCDADQVCSNFGCSCVLWVCANLDRRWLWVSCGGEERGELGRRGFGKALGASGQEARVDL